MRPLRCRPVRAKKNESLRAVVTHAIEARLEFYAAWKSHVDAGFDPSREECVKLAAMFGVEPPPLANQDEEMMLQVVQQIATTPGGQKAIEALTAIFLKAEKDPVENAVGGEA